MSSEELRLFDKVRVYLDEDFSSAEHFTVRRIVSASEKTLEKKSITMNNFYIPGPR